MITKFSHHRHGNELLTSLLESSGYVTTDALLQKLGISRRSLFYLINKVNEELDGQTEFPISNVKNLGYYLPDETIAYLNQFNDQQPTQIVTNSSKQRQEFMAFTILNANGLSLERLTRQFNVSKNTVIRDVRQVDRDFHNYDLKIINTKAGKQVGGKPDDIRRWVYDHAKILREVNPNTPSEKISITSIKAQITLFERISGKYLTDDARHTITTFLHWHLNRLILATTQLVSNSDVPTDLHTNLDFIWAKSFLSDYGLYSRIEAEYLLKLINSSQFSHVNWDDPIINKLKPLAIQMITDFNQLSGAHVSIKGVADSLTVHLLSAYYRSIYRMPFEYPDLMSIKTEYQRTFDITKSVARPFEALTKQTLSDDEVALIAIYFGGAIREQKHQTKTHDEILVVCSSGIGTSRLLLHQLEIRYSGIHFSQPMNMLQYENSDLSNVRLILSTIRLPQRSDIPITTVSALPSMLEWKIIDRDIAKTGLKSAKNTRPFDPDTLIGIVENYAKITNPTGLKNALFDYLNQLSRPEPANASHNSTSAMMKLLRPKNIGFLSGHYSWQTAIRVALEPLLADSTVEKSYIDQIIALTEQNGPYMVIGSGIMLAHAAPRDGVNALGASLFLLEHPMSIEQSERSIRLIIGLAPADETQHLPFLSELLEVVQDPQWLAGLYKLKNTAAIIDYLNVLQQVK